MIFQMSNIQASYPYHNPFPILYLPDATKELSITVSLCRHSVHHVVFVYLPSLLIVCLSCLVFWLPLSDLLERLLFVCTLLVSLLAIVLLTAINSPTVGYMKAIDLWVIVCFLFICIALLESILIYLLSNKRPEPPGNANEFELMVSLEQVYLLAPSI